MSKKSKKWLIDNWDYDWESLPRDEDIKRERDEERRLRREQKTQYTHYDWDDEN